MFNHAVYQKYLEEYKSIFPDRWKREKFKWQAVKCFQDNWNIDAEDFSGMLSEAFKKSGNLLASAGKLPLGMLEQFSNTNPEKVRYMFSVLFDESADLLERIDQFKQSSNELLEEWRLSDSGREDKVMHYQDENSIMTYLWMRYPEKYYIYKFSEVKAVSNVLQSSYAFKKGNYHDNIINFMDFYDEVHDELIKNNDLIDSLDSFMSDEGYVDPHYRTLTIDYCFYVSRLSGEEGWVPVDYDPGLTTEDWIDLLNDETVFYNSNLEVMKRFKDIGGEATCTELAEKYGESPGFYNITSSKLADRIIKKTNCEVYEDDRLKRWPVLFLGKPTDEKGTFVYKLRDELSQALDSIDLSDIPLYVNDEDEIYYWWLAANPNMFDITLSKIGETNYWTLYNENGNKRKIFQNFLDARVGDKIIGYQTSPIKKIMALYEVSEESDGELIGVKKLEDFANPIDYSEIKDAPELADMEFFINPQGSLFKLTEDEYNYILDLVREYNPLPQMKKYDTYNEEQFIEEVYMDKTKYTQIMDVLESKKNIILQGPPGVGKTFMAERLAYSKMGEKDDGRIEFVQFHQNYSYEDFVMGYKPDDNGFSLEYGVFYRFCKKAAIDSERDYFFIIDEINRGNLSKIFGELLMAIENGYRGKNVKLAYKDIEFNVPSNLYIIGMMNTADRSLALIDYALRRRFSFIDIEPGFDSEGFLKFKNTVANDKFDKLIDTVKELNEVIKSDNSLGKGFCIGHSYFCDFKDDAENHIKAVVEFDLIPMIEEYWFDKDEIVRTWKDRLRGAINEKV